VAAGVAQKPALGDKTAVRLDNREGDQFGIGQLRSDPGRRARRSKLRRRHLRDPQVPDQPGLPQLGQGAEVPGDRLPPHVAQVHQVQVVPAGLPQVPLDAAAQLLRPRCVRPGPAAVPARTEIVLPRTGHMFRFTHPDQYGQAITAFIDQRVSTRAATT
jgi:hypothetical protein